MVHCVYVMWVDCVVEYEGVHCVYVMWVECVVECDELHCGCVWWSVMGYIVCM